MIKKRRIDLKFLIMIAFLFGASINSHAQYRNEQDKKISLAVLDQYKRDCSHKSGVDQVKVIELQEVFDKLRSDRSSLGEKALVCYQERMSQIVGIHQLYKDLCAEVTRGEFVKKDGEVLRLVSMTQRYSKGVGPFHDLLNDCLVEKNASKYLVKSTRQRTESANLRYELELIKVTPPFEASRAEFR